MARRHRIWYPGAVYHVMSRGNRRHEIFKSNKDYENFLELILEARDRFPFWIHSICLMTNHFHMEIETDEVELSKIMQRILGIYAEGYNRRYKYTGHLFEGRYTSVMILNDTAFLEVSRYIHLNPVKAKMAPEPGAYRYSSYELFASDTRRVLRGKAGDYLEEIVDVSGILSLFQGDAREGYKAFVQDRESHADEEEKIQVEMRENEFWLPDR